MSGIDGRAPHFFVCCRRHWGLRGCVDGCVVGAGKQAPRICGCGTSDIDTDGDGTAANPGTRTVHMRAMATQHAGRKQGEAARGDPHGVGVDVDEHFAAVAGGGGGRHRCAHCDKVMAGTGQRKAHMGTCKSLPRHVREVLDHAAARASRAEQGRYGGEQRGVYCTADSP